MTPSEFIERWRASGASERSNYQLFLSELHDELDRAVAEAYGWEPGLDKEEILQRLVDLNAQRRAEEEEGKVRWLHPEYQTPEETQTQAELELDVDLPSDGDVTESLPWPSEMKERARALQQVMTQTDRALTVEEVAQHFHRARRDDVQGLLETLKLSPGRRTTYRLRR